jgi:N-acetylated-alpha-linked acidic dipeptidase
LTYHVGPGPAKVHLSLEMDYGQRRLINVTGMLAGSVYPNEWVILGSHRDAWTFGAADSVSGHVSVMAVARAMGQMVKKGWRPRRTIVFVSWDGEEPGLLGSTEWIEDLTAELQAKAAIYINRDAGATGPFFGASAVHSLVPFLRELAHAMPSDDPSKTLYDRWLERARDLAARDGQPPPIQPLVGALGSGSDYSGFVDHLGVAAVDLGLNGASVDGTYHSTYDNPQWFKRFIDPQFRFSVLASQVTGVAVLRLADADVLPFDYEAYGRQIRDYVIEIERDARTRSAADARRVDFTGLKSAATDFARAGADLRHRVESALEGTPAAVAALAAFDQRMIKADRALTESAGLPGRPWYKHTVYAPGLYTGYAVKTIPGVREAIDAGDFGRAAEQAEVVERALERATSALKGK